MQSAWQSWQRKDDRKLDAEQAVLRMVGEWCGDERAECAVRALRDRGHGVIAFTIAVDLGVHISTNPLQGRRRRPIAVRS